MSSYRNYYESGSLSRPLSRTDNKSDAEKSNPSKIGTNFRSSAYGLINQNDRTARESKYGCTKDPEKSLRDKYSAQEKSSLSRDKFSTNTSTYPGRSETARLKTALEKKSTPPVTYRTLSRTGTRSRDPSPVERDKTEYRQYPRTYAKSTSREPEPSLKYGSRSDVSVKEDLSRYDRAPSKEDLTTRLKSTTSGLPKYISSSRHSSTESLSNPSTKYINSRFLPKNSVEKSYTAYHKPSNAEDKRRSRDNLMVVLQTHASIKNSVQNKLRDKSIEPVQEKPAPSHDKPPIVEEETETVTIVNRGTSPTPPSQSSGLRTRRTDVARIVQRDITRPKKRQMTDKEVQSDRMDDTARYSRFGNSSTVATAAPWSSYLDLKFNSPRTSYSSSSKYSSPSHNSSNTSRSEQGSGDISLDVEKSMTALSISETSESNKIKHTNSSDSINSISRNNSSKSISLKSKDASKSKTLLSSTSITDPSKSLPKSSCDSSNHKMLPPPVPKNDNSKSTSTSQSLNVLNKDFRKSVLNMNTDGKLSKVSSTRSTSVSSDSEPNSTELSSTKLSTTPSLSKIKSNSSISKLPQRISTTKSDKDDKSRRSPSACSESSASTASSSEDDSHKSKSKKKILSAGSSRTSMILSSADELSMDKPSKPPPSPRLKQEGPKTEAEAKSFLMRALAPVANLFKTKSQDSVNTNNPKFVIKHVESGERAWWLDETVTPPEGVQRFSESDATNSKTRSKLDDQDYDGKLWSENDTNSGDGKHVYKIRRNESGQVEWWIDESETTNSSLEKKPSAINQPNRIRHVDSGERAWWMTSNENITDVDSKQDDSFKGESKPKVICHQDSEEQPWWLTNSNIPEGLTVISKTPDSSDSEDDKEPLGDRASPEGLESEICGRLSPYDNVSVTRTKSKRPTNIPLFISRHTNIDDILGGSNQLLSPLMDRIQSFQDMKLSECEEVDAGQVRIHDSTAQRPVIQPAKIDIIDGFLNSTSGFNNTLDDAALQLYKDGDYGSYLDLEASISEQQEEFDGFQTNKKNSIVLRTQLSVRVHTIIEKLLTSEGRELRRALFSLKQIFQEDKDLVHEFVQNDGLACLIKVGSEADQNYQNYILRALGQVMLYVDGMNGVMDHNQTVQWLYTLIASKFRLVVKTALKLLLVFVEYVDSNCMLLIKAVNAVDNTQGIMPWSNIMRLLKDFNSADTELLIYAMTLVNKCLNGIPDQDTYYDQTDALEEQGIEGIIQRYMSKQGTDLDLLQQFQIYEAVLQHEDGEDKGMPLRHLDESIRKTLRNRKSMVQSAERRKSRRHSTGNTPVNGTNNHKHKFYSLQTNILDDEDESSSQSSNANDHNLNGSYKENNKANDVGVTPALRRRRERAERQRSFIREQQESAAFLRASFGISDDAENGNYTNNSRIPNGNVQLCRNTSRKDLTPLMNAVNKLDSSSEDGILKKPWVLQMMYGKPIDNENEENEANADDTNDNDRKILIQLKRENTVKDLTQKLTNQNIIHSPSDEGKVNRIGDTSGLISKAKEGLAKSKSKADVLKSPTSENIPKVIEVKKSENELRWEELVHSVNRPLNLCDMDFTDLHSEDEVDILAPAATTNGIPPPPPPLCKDSAPPPPPISNRNPPPFPVTPIFGVNLQRTPRLCQETTKTNTIKKNKKTVKLFWKEVRDDPIVLTKLQKFGGMIWDELHPVTIDTQKLEHLFESRAKDLINKKQQEMNKNKEIIVLDHKRSNAINIGMTKLPPPRSIKTAILKMDATIMNREGIEKLLTMLPTEEERTKIQEAQAANPDLPLGSAEQFLLTLASISELPARLKLWAFKLDFENTEREIAEPLMDLKQGIELLKANKTFRGILSTLLSIGIFLNGNEVKGFQIEYLAKVPEVKDTVHKHSLLHHLCHIVMEKFPEATDLYSEIGAITRASKIDFDELSLNIQRLEADCKASWDHLKLIAKHDGSTMMKVKMSDFLADCAERIILLGIVHRRVINRYHKFLLWLGIPMHRITDSKPNEFCRVVSEFALEYRTTRERVLQQLEKKANHRERNKTRGKMITEVGKFRSKEDRADAELRQLLGSDISDVESMQGTLPWRRQRRDVLNHSALSVPNGNLTDDGDDEILESLVKTATKAPTSRATPRERKRTRHADRKSLRRTLKNGLSEEEKKHIAAYIKGY